MQIVKIILIAAMSISISGCEDLVNKKVTSDAEKEYEIAKRQGDKMQICVQAGFVAASYLQAHDEEAYNKWKLTEAIDCANAGLPKT